MGWIPGWASDPVAPKGNLVPVAITLHRTYGGWPGDYSVGKQGLFQFLIGQEVGQRVQFMSTDSVAYHCNGSNFKSFGVEITGTNEDVPTDWQVACLGEILRYGNSEHGIPLDYLDPFSVPPASVWVNGGGFAGVLSHYSVKPDNNVAQHTDLIFVADYNRALGVSPLPPEPEEVDMLKLEHTSGNYVYDATGKRHIGGSEDAMLNAAGVKSVPINDAQLAEIPDQPTGVGGAGVPAKFTVTSTVVPG